MRTPLGLRSHFRIATSSTQVPSTGRVVRTSRSCSKTGALSACCLVAILEGSSTKRAALGRGLVLSRTWHDRELLNRPEVRPLQPSDGISRHRQLKAGLALEESFERALALDAGELMAEAETWIFENKWDWFRVVAWIEHDKVTLYSAQ
jgi:hypothetical protein